MINNQNIEWISKKPFKIFSIPNFLNDKYYSEINANFPSFEDIKKEYFFKYENDKYAITSGSSEYNKLILQNKVLLNFHNFINSKNFKAAKIIYKDTEYESSFSFIKAILFSGIFGTIFGIFYVTIQNSIQLRKKN